MSIVLHHDWDSFKSFKVRVCLSEKRLAWTGKIVSLAAFDHFDREFLALNPAGTIPILVHDGKVVRESSIINEYLDDISSEFPLKPDDPYQRAQMRLWARMEDEVVHPAVRVPTFNLMAKKRVRALPPGELDRLLARGPNRARVDAYRSAVFSEIDERTIVSAIKTLLHVAERMEITLSQSAWLSGKNYSLADVAMTAFVDRIEILGMEDFWSDRPNLQNWIDRIKTRPSYAAALPLPGTRMPAPDHGLVQKFMELAKQSAAIALAT